LIRFIGQLAFDTRRQPGRLRLLHAGAYRGNFEAFLAAGGKGRFFGYRVPGGNGHGVMQFPRLWAGEVDRYLGALKAR